MVPPSNRGGHLDDPIDLRREGPHVAVVEQGAVGLQRELDLAIRSGDLRGIRHGPLHEGDAEQRGFTTLEGEDGIRI